MPTHRISKLGVGFVPEERRIFPDLTVWENLDIARRGSVNGSGGWGEDEVFDLFPDLAEIRTRLGGVLSGGQQQMLTIARSLMGNPRLLLLDEPSEGLAPRVVENVREKVGQLKASGMESNALLMSLLRWASLERVGVGSNSNSEAAGLAMSPEATAN